MTISNESLIKIKADVTDAISSLNRLQNELDETAGSTENVGKVSKVSFDDMVKGMKAFTGAVTAAGYASMKLADNLAELSQKKLSFEMLRETNYELSQAVKNTDDWSRGMLRANDMAGIVNEALIKGIPLTKQKYQELIELSTKLALAQNKSVQEVMEGIIVGVARLSPPIQENSGIVVDNTKAQEALAAALGKTTAELTETEKRQAVLNSMVDAGKEKVKDYAGVLNGETAKNIQALRQYSNMLKSAFEGTAEFFLDLGKTIGDVAWDIRTFFVGGKDSTELFIESYEQNLDKAINKAGELGAAFYEAQLEFGDYSEEAQVELKKYLNYTSKMREDLKLTDDVAKDLFGSLNYANQIKAQLELINADDEKVRKDIAKRLQSYDKLSQYFTKEELDRKRKAFGERMKLRREALDKDKKAFQERLAIAREIADMAIKSPEEYESGADYAKAQQEAEENAIWMAKNYSKIKLKEKQIEGEGNDAILAKRQELIKQISDLMADPVKEFDSVEAYEEHYNKILQDTELLYDNIENIEIASSLRRLKISEEIRQAKAKEAEAAAEDAKKKHEDFMNWQKQFDAEELAGRKKLYQQKIKIQKEAQGESQAMTEYFAGMAQSTISGVMNHMFQSVVEGEELSFKAILGTFGKIIGTQLIADGTKNLLMAMAMKVNPALGLSGAALAGVATLEIGAGFAFGGLANAYIPKDASPEKDTPVSSQAGNRGAAAADRNAIQQTKPQDLNVNVFQYPSEKAMLSAAWETQKKLNR